jgi:ppGpp synthetase/RelA/SpoT-type nucleotidyltranferase
LLEYPALASLAEVVRSSLTTEIGTILHQANFALTTPIQSRVKSSRSIIEKLQRVSYSVNTLTDLEDLVGLRVILQFRRDVKRVCDLIAENLIPVKRYKTHQKRFREHQFGYSSHHIVAKLNWERLGVPADLPIANIKVEIQVRTTAQHLWAEASQTLQYKQNQSVPAELREYCCRVSGLLQQVDLAFERLLSKRDVYRSQLQIERELPQKTLNVDLLEKTLDALLPPENKDPDEEYAQLLTELLMSGISTRQQLLAFYRKHKEAILAKEADCVSRSKRSLHGGAKIVAWTLERRERGVYFSHVGLIRSALRGRT